MTEQKIEAVEDDVDDVVIIGEVMPKPMLSNAKEKPKRHVELKRSKCRNEDLVITQKVKMKKRKYHCVLKKAKVNDTEAIQDSEKNTSEVKDKCERDAPVCMRKVCRDRNCKVEAKRVTNERRRTERRHQCDFPRDLKRLLSPVSSSPLERDLSFDLEISFDTSSLQETRESKLDTLIKRTRDRDRKNQITRTQQLRTPPPICTNMSNKDISEAKKLLDITDYKPPFTSTPKYEDNDDQISSITSNNNVTDFSKRDNSPSLEDVHLLLSPIKNPDNVAITKNINSKEQGSQCFISLLIDTNNQDPKSKSVNVVSSMNNEINTVETTVHISNINEVSKGNILCKDMQVQNIKSAHVQTDVPNVNCEQSIKGQRPLLENKQIQHKASEYIQTVVSDNQDKNVANSNRMSISNKIDKSRTNKCCSPSIESTKIVQKKSESTQTNFNTNDEKNIADRVMRISNTIVERPNQNIFSGKPQKEQQNSDISTTVTSLDGLQIDDRKLLTCNMKTIDNPSASDIQTKNSEYIQNVYHTHSEHNIENINIPINNTAHTTTEHNSLYTGDINTQHKEMQTAISDTNHEQNITDSHMSISYMHFKDQTRTTNNLLDHNKLNKNIEHTDTVKFDTNNGQIVEAIDMSISYDNDDNFIEQPLTHSLTYEEAHLQYRQSEYYLQTTAGEINYDNNSNINHNDDFHANYKQIVESNQMSISCNNVKEQQNSYSNQFYDDNYLQLQQKTYLVSQRYYEQNNNFVQQYSDRDYNHFDNDSHEQDIQYDPYNDIISADSNKYNKHNVDDRDDAAFYDNYTEQHNRSPSPFLEDSLPQKQSEFHSDANRNLKQNCYSKMSICDDSNMKEQLDRPFFEDIHNQHKKYYNTDPDKRYEQTRDKSNRFFYDNYFKGTQNNRRSRSPHFGNRQHTHIDIMYSTHSNKIHEQNMSVSYNNNRSNEHQNKTQRFTKNLHEQHRKSEYRTSYSTQQYEQNIENRNYKDSQHKKYNHTHVDEFRKTHARNTDHRDMSISYKSDNFKGHPAKRRSPCFDESQHKKSKYIQYCEQKIEDRKMSIRNKNSYFEDKKRRGYNGRVEDRRQYFEHRKSSYHAVSKKKVEIFIDKRMSDEAYEDVLVGLPPGRVSPDLP